MKICLICGARIPSWIMIDGKNRNLKNRKYCFNCSPFGKRNTLQLHIRTKRKNHTRFYSDLSQEEKKTLNKSTAIYQGKRRKQRKLILVAEKGGKCSICGYKDNLACLDFHHLDPRQKSFDITAREIYAKPMEILRAESAKCQLLCCRCHRELHNPDSKMGPQGLEPC
jgi:hypothetical protein